MGREGESPQFVSNEKANAGWDSVLAESLKIAGTLQLVLTEAF